MDYLFTNYSFLAFKTSQNISNVAHLSANHIFMVTNYPHIVCLKYVWFSLTSPLGFVVSSSWNILSQHSCLCHLTHSSRTHLKSSFLKLFLFPQSVTIWLTPPALCVSSLQYLKYFFSLSCRNFSKCKILGIRNKIIHISVCLMKRVQ